MSEPDADRVECTSGHTYAQEPRTVIWQGRRYAVTAIVGRWRTPEGPAFRLATASGVLFDVQYHELDDVWMIRVISAGE